MSCYTPGVRKEQEIGSNTDDGWTVVDAIDRGRHVTAASSISLGYVAEISLNFL